MAITASPPVKKNNLRPSRRQVRMTFMLLLFINILNYADRYILPAILRKVQAPPQLGGLGLTDFQAGLIGSSFLLVYAFATLPLGIWADRGIRKNIVALCVGLWSMATLFAGATVNFIQLFAVRAVLGIGEAGYAPASLSLLGDYFDKERRGRVLSFWSSGTLIGSALGFALGGLIADTLGWRWAFYIVGLPGLLAAFLIWRSTEPRRGVFDSEDENDDAAADGHASIGPNFWSSAGKLLRIPTFWTLLGALTFSFFTIGGTSFWLPSYFADTFHLSTAKAGFISSLVLVSGGLIGTVLGGLLADYMQQRWLQGRLFVATLGFLAGAPLVLIALLLHSLPLFIATFVIAAIFLSFCTGPLNAVIQDVIKPDLRATAVGLSLLFAHLLGDAAAPSLIGFVSDRLGLDRALLVTGPTALVLAGLVCLLGMRTVARDMRAMQEELRRERAQRAH